jgi:hypothetical protein
MNTNGLAKLYDRLTPKERLPLLLAASARGDEAERDRLARSAPREGFRLPDYHGLAEGLLLASLFHLLELLDLAALYWQTGGLLEQWEALADEDDDHAPPQRLRATVGMFSCLLTAKLDGWRRFCSEFKIDAELLMSDLPGYDTVKRTEEAARIMTCTAEEASAWLREASNETAQALTAESVAASLWHFVNNRAEWWG